MSIGGVMKLRSCYGMAFITALFLFTQSDTLRPGYKQLLSLYNTVMPFPWIT